MNNDPWYVGPPARPPPDHCHFVTHYLEKHHFQQYIISRFGFAFWLVVVQSRIPVVLPIVTFGETWVVALYILV